MAVNRPLKSLLGVAVFAVLGGPVLARAEGAVVTDGTVGPATRVAGPEFAIPESLGTRTGNNLFHSFQTFNLEFGETATFTGSASIQNVVARVTGGTASSIDGTLRSQIGQASFYFINPAGVVLGPNAVVDVPAAFHVSTADELRFPGGARFSASEPVGSSLSVAHPTAFGFLATSTGNNGLLKVEGGRIGRFDEPSGKVIDLVGRDIRAEFGTELHAPGGEIRAVAYRGRGEVSLETDADGRLPLPAAVPDRTRGGSIELTDTRVFADGAGGGRISLWGNRVELTDGTGLIADNTGSTENAGSGLRARVGSLRLDNSLLSADSTSEPAGAGGKAGNIRVVADRTVDITNGGAVLSDTFGDGDAGQIEVSAGTITVDGGLVSARARSESPLNVGSGNAGSVRLAARRDVRLIRGGSVTADSFGTGRPGEVSVNAGGDVSIDSMDADDDDGTGLSSDSVRGTNSTGGRVSVRAGGDVAVRNSGLVSTDTFGGGAAGDVDVRAGRDVVVQGSAFIASATFGDGRAGTVSVRAGNDLRIVGQDAGVFTVGSVGSSGAAGTVSASAGGDVVLRAGGRISSNALGDGDGGNVRVNAGNVRIDGQDAVFTGISSDSDPFSGGSAGDVSVTARGDVDLSHNGFVRSNAFGAGNAGAVRVNAARVRVDTGATIAATASINSAGGTGDVSVQASDRIVVNRGGVVSLENSVTVGDPDAVQPGRIRLRAPDIALGGPAVTASSSGNVDAGSVQIEVGRLLTLERATVRTTAADSDGGAITVSGTGAAVLRNAAIQTSVTGAGGNGGDIQIRNAALVLDRGRIEANAVSGRGGDIALAVQVLLASRDSINGRSASGRELFDAGPVSDDPAGNIVQAASETGVSGTISLTVPQLNLAGVLANVGNPAFEMRRMQPDPCSRGPAAGALVVSGRGGLLERGDDLLLP